MVVAVVIGPTSTAPSSIVADPDIEVTNTGWPNSCDQVAHDSIGYIGVVFESHASIHANTMPARPERQKTIESIINLAHSMRGRSLNRRELVANDGNPPH